LTLKTPLSNKEMFIYIFSPILDLKKAPFSSLKPMHPLIYEICVSDLIVILLIICLNRFITISMRKEGKQPKNRDRCLQRKWS
jgi:hypothetical protein